MDEFLSAVNALMADARLVCEYERLPRLTRETLSDAIDRAEKAMDAMRNHAEPGTYADEQERSFPNT